MTFRTWAWTGQINGTVTKCGTFSPSHTASGALTMYAAPASVPTQLSASAASVNITAVSTADPTKSETVTLNITRPPISIAFAVPPNNAADKLRCHPQRDDSTRLHQRGR